MDIYSLIKFLHVVSAVVWVGGGFSMVLLGIAADRATDKEGFVRIVQGVIYLTPRLFIPASLAALVFGLVAAFISWGFSSLWIDLGLIGWIASFGTGFFVIKPRAEEAAKVIAKEGASDNAMAIGRDMLNVAKFDYVMLFSIIAVMVFKPAPSDWLVLAIIAIAIIAGGYFYLAPVLMRTARTATA